MLKWIGTISAVALATALYEKRKATPRNELETVADAELRKVLLYAAPPTFLAPVEVLERRGPQRRWLDRAANH